MRWVQVHRNRRDSEGGINKVERAYKRRGARDGHTHIEVYIERGRLCERYVGKTRTHTHTHIYRERDVNTKEGRDN